jgi:hypothetical protein
MNEFYGAGTIDKSIVVSHEIRGRDRDLDTHTVMPRFLTSITDTASGVHAALPLDRASAGQYRFEQSRFAALEWPDQRDAP